MRITKEQRQQLYAAAKPLIEWMGKNCHPHCTAHVDLGGVELVEGIAAAFSCHEEDSEADEP